MSDSLSKVLVLYTGGTIGMLPEDPENPGSPLRPVAKEALNSYIRNPLDQISWEIKGLLDNSGNAVGPLDSSSVGPKHWAYMARAIGDAYTSYDGFVILHGTDTMAYTASALSFLLQNLDKPVVLTGSQLPIFHSRTDAIMNFTTAINIAGYRATGLPRVPEVVICFGDVLLRGNRTVKVSTSRWQGFVSPNYPILGRIGEHIDIQKSLLLPMPDERTPFSANTAMEESVVTIPIYPGMDAKIVDQMLGMDAKGFILRTFGSGNVPENNEFIEAIKRAVDTQKIVVNTTQCAEGSVDMSQYAGGFALQNAGVITGLDLTPEAALTKLMWLLAVESLEEAATQMQISQRGEQSGSVFDVRYGHVGDKSRPLEIAKVSSRPAGQFQTKALKRAVLRLFGLGIDGSEKGSKVSLSVFINLPNARADTPENMPQYAGEISGVYNGEEETTLTMDVTSTVARVYASGHPLHLTLIALAKRKFWAKGVYLNLFTEPG